MDPRDPLAEKRAEAQAAMEDDAHRQAETTKAAEQEKRRILARQAMEGEERRKRREDREKLIRNRRLETETKSAAAEAAVKSAQDAAAAAEAAKAKAAAEQTATQQRRVESIEESEGLIEKLRTKTLNISPLRTFKTDMARAVQEEGVSISKIAMSEQARGQLEKVAPTPSSQPPRSGHPWRFLFLVILILGGAGGAYWWFFLKPADSIVTPIVTTPSNPTGFIFTESSQTLDLENDEDRARQALQAAANPNDLPAKSMKYLSFHRPGATPSWKKTSQALGINIPANLQRNLDESFMFGVYNTGTDNFRFLILKTGDFPLAYAGLLDWEPTMADSLLPILRGSNPSASERQGSFIDRLIQNKDARLLKSAGAATTTLLYAFLDPATILITENEETFTAVFDRYRTGIVD